MRIRKVLLFLICAVLAVGCASGGDQAGGEGVSGMSDTAHMADEPTEAAELAPWPPPVVAPWPADQIAPWPTHGWSTSSPEAQGIDSKTLIEMLEYADSSNAFHSILLVRNGYLVMEAYWAPFTADDLHVQYSITKSNVSVLTGITYKDGLISGLDQPVIELFPDLDPEGLAEGAAQMTVRQVLMMAAGLDTGVVATEQILAAELKYAPGTSFQYGNSGPQLMANAIQQLAGKDPLDYAQERLFGPLGIAPEYVSWATAMLDIRDGGTGLELRPRDMAKIGYLYLNHGMWDGEVILPEEWVEWSVYPNQVPDFDNLGVPADGYGFFWWVNRQEGYYLAAGHGGQLIVVFPGENMILVVTGDSRVSQGAAQGRAVTDFIAPMEIAGEPLPENSDAAAELEALIQQIGGLE